MHQFETPDTSCAHKRPVLGAEFSFRGVTVVAFAMIGFTFSLIDREMLPLRAIGADVRAMYRAFQPYSRPAPTYESFPE